MFDKILIANRGEIACRIIATAGRLGVRTVAIYSEADSKAKHVAMADEAWCIGPPPAQESYLQADSIIDVALKSGAKAIHPGYGFLSENADFAQKCLDNSLVFIGPPIAAIQAMGSKSAAKDIMINAGVPLVPGYHGEDQSLDNLLQAAKEIGFPVLLKASAGGGGKGMKIVECETDFAQALDSCKREAKASFLNDEILLEKYLTQPRHVEIQIFSDHQGNTVHLFERDCSVQRRHQKVIEEAPAPGLSDAVRTAMSNVAIQAADAIGYRGAGTVEFLYDQDDSFYFMEMNTRLQVEHPVTEMITGIDLVEWQLLVANGQALPLKQQQIQCNGHAFEVRIYAEDPDQDFLPATGRIVHLNSPSESAHVRVDTGIRQDDEVSIYYDPMIAKLIVWERDRSTALARLRGALADYQVVGLATNLEFLSALAANTAFNELQIDTSFIQKQQQQLFPAKKPVSDESVALAALYVLQNRVRQAEQQALQSSDPYSPWHLVTGWQNNAKNHHDLEFIDFQSMTNSSNENEIATAELISAKIHFEKQAYQIEVSGSVYTASATLCDKRLTANLSGQRIDAQIIEHDNKLYILTHGKTVILGFIDSEHSDNEDSCGSLTAPMPGTVITVNVAIGDYVKQDQPLLVLEAMKMEHSINAPVDGIIKELFYQPGEMVDEGAELIVVE
ncbi:MAG: acetyl/propionyl/methylcrotonyl-CoA carboxylase subunit alpha [Gammaproteobacteria bacterium]|nr:acetyl/propionyl/methylcrotonyl-CoA carboxylase subunit alpha [Gammaproteobacteria bacterium]